MLGALTGRTRATTDALLREARFDAVTGRERHSAGEPSPSLSNGSFDINVLRFTTKIKQCVPFWPPSDCSFKLEIAFCVRGVITEPCGVPFSVSDHLSILEYTGPHPFLNEAEDPSIPDKMLEDLNHPFV